MWPSENMNSLGPFAAPVPEEPTKGNVAFLLGAGASVEAQVPDTAGLIKGFAMQDGHSAQIGSLIEKLKKWTEAENRVVDIELVLEILQRLADWPQEPLAALQEQPIQVDGVEPQKLLEALRDFIKQKVVVDPEKTQYLDPLRGFVDSEKPLSVYSLNYDTAMEVFCARHRLVYRDGFGEDWNPQVFGDPNVDLLLFKLHGSVTWYRTDQGRFLKIPVMVKESTVELVTKERATALMLYPAQKLAYVEPLFELLLEMKKRLATCQFLVAVGYSFRDDHIRQILWDVARFFPAFTVILISPEAGKIYRERLAQYAHDVPSALRGRVICLPFAFGRVLPVLQQEYIKSARAFMNEWENRSSQERQGLPRVPWTQAAQEASRCGHIAAVRSILEKSDAREGIWYLDRLEIVIRALFFAVANNDLNNFQYFWKATEAVWQDFLKDATVDTSHKRFHMVVNRRPYQSEIRDLLERNQRLQREIMAYQDLMVEKPKTASAIVKARELLMFIGMMMSCWGGPGSPSPEDYADNRRGTIAADFRNLLAILQREEDGDKFKAQSETFFLEQRIKDLEAAVIEKIFKDGLADMIALLKITRE